MSFETLTYSLKEKRTLSCGNMGYWSHRDWDSDTSVFCGLAFPSQAAVASACLHLPCYLLLQRRPAFVCAILEHVSVREAGFLSFNSE